eukprot:557270-Prorocentrum_minimum.AAC.1
MAVASTAPPTSLALTWQLPVGCSAGAGGDSRGPPGGAGDALQSAGGGGEPMAPHPPAHQVWGACPRWVNLPLRAVNSPFPAANSPISGR